MQCGYHRNIGTGTISQSQYPIAMIPGLKNFGSDGTNTGNIEISFAYFVD